MKRSLMVVPFCLLCCLTALFPEHDLRLGLIYLEKAVESYKAGGLEQAAGLLETSGEFMELTSDSYFLRARLLEENGKTGPAGEDDFYQSSPLVTAYYRQALEADNWRFFSPSDFLVHAARTVFREKSYQEVLTILSRRPFYERALPEEVWMEAYSLAQLGERGPAVERLKEGLLFDPANSGLLSLLFLLSPEERERYTRLLGDEAIPEDGQRNRLILALLPAMEPEEDIRKILSLYKRYDLFSLEAEIIFIQYYGLDTHPDLFTPVLENLVRSGLFENAELTAKLYQALPFSGQKEKLEELFSGFSGVQILDENYDRFPELKIRLEGGGAQSVDWNPRQDHQTAYRVLYREGRPVSFQTQAGPMVFVDYEAYPWVRRLSFSGDGEIVVYEFLPGNFSFPIGLWKSPFEPFTADFPLIVFAELKDRARRVAVYRPGAVSPLEEYIPLRRQEGLAYRYPESSGDFSRRFYLKNNEILLEAWNLLDRDYWDTLFYYDAGMLRLLAHDAGDDQYYEYEEEILDGGLSMAWDWNQNGFFECRQTVEGGKILREYSSRDDGNYDILVEIEVDR